MLAVEWIDRLKVKTGIESDYGIAKLLGVSTQYISQIRTKKSRSLSAKIAIKVAEHLEVDALDLIKDQNENKYQRQAGFADRDTLISLLFGSMAANIFLGGLYILCQIDNYKRSLTKHEIREYIPALSPRLVLSSY